MTDNGRATLLTLRFIAAAAPGAALAGLVPSSASSQTFELLHAFEAPPSRPFYQLTQAADGAFYGVASDGGPYDLGILFKINADGTELVLIHEFMLGEGTASGALLEASDGDLYGLTANGGPSLRGSLFKVRKDGTGFQVVHYFSYGSPGAGEGISPNGKLVEGSDGALYGTTFHGGAHDKGTVFKIERNGYGFRTLHDFDDRDPADGANPWAGLVGDSDGVLYGTTYYGGAYGSGTVFKINEDGTDFEKLHDFRDEDRTNGERPDTELILASDGSLYGTTRNGGASNAGTLFRLKGGKSLTFKILHDFVAHGAEDGRYPETGVIEGSDGFLYGTTWAGGTYDLGILFKVDKGGNGYTRLHDFDGTDGSAPRGEFVEGSDGLLYGTASGDNFGRSTAGTIFKIKKKGTGFALLHEFSYGDGRPPSGATIEASDGSLYGTTLRGGEFSDGTVFKLDKDGGGFLALFDLSKLNYDSPSAVIEASDGRLYGTAPHGLGGFSSGGVFYVNTDGTGYGSLHTFGISDQGELPLVPVIQGSDGDLYGTTSEGGVHGRGTIFKVTLDGHHVKLHDFDGLGGGLPTGRLIEGSDGALYGTTYESDVLPGLGIIFKIQKSGFDFRTLHYFGGGSDGSRPTGGLLEASDGNLYGTTSDGGFEEHGTLFTIRKNGTGYAILHSFRGSPLDGASPNGDLVEMSDGAFYGTTEFGGAYGEGIAFRMSRATTGLVNIHDFEEGDPANGENPHSGLIAGSDGFLYGMTPYGGPAGAGTVYRLILSIATPTPPAPLPKER